MITEQMIMEDQTDGEAGLTEARQGEIMEVTRTNIPIIDPLITNTTMIVYLGQKIERMTDNQKILEGNTIRKASHRLLLKNYPK